MGSADVVQTVSDNSEDSDDAPLLRKAPAPESKECLEVNIYELQRKENIERNEKAMEALGLSKALRFPKVLCKKKKGGLENDVYRSSSSESSDE